MTKQYRSWTIVYIIGAIFTVGAFIVGIVAVSGKPTGFRISASTWLILGVAVVGLLIIIPIALAFISPNRRGLHELRQLQWADFRAWTRRMELWFIGFLLVLAAAAFVAAYFATHAVLESVQQQRLGPNETAQVITAVGGLGLAIGTSIAAIIKAYALLMRARADVIRAKMNLPPAEESATMPNRQLPRP